MTQKIISLRAENFKRLKAVEIEPDGTTVVIRGRNAQGKSSVLDAIMAALSGKKGSKELVRPIRDGESKAVVVVELDELVVERRWTQGGSTVTVSPRGGNAKLNSPQKVLDELIGSLSFDPLNFAEADPKSQVESLIDAMGQRSAFDRIAEERREAYDERTQVNRDLKRSQAQYEAVADASEPVKPVDVSALTDALDVAMRLDGLRSRWNSLDEEIKRLRAQQSEIETEASEITRKAGPADLDVASLRQRLGSAEQTNEAARRHQEWVELGRTVEDNRQASEDLTDRIRQLDEEKQALLKGYAPVDGLSIDDDGITYNGVPFVQASAAERLKVSVAMAMALNPDLRVICIRDASLLDEDSRKALVDMATEHDYQIWYEVVGTGEGVGVIIEDGEVQA